MQVLSKCNKVLELPTGHAKARFRRAKAYTQLGRLQEARADLDKLLEAEPGDKAVGTPAQEVAGVGVLNEG
jgi:predicted Zn-dependent protease